MRGAAVEWNETEVLDFLVSRQHSDGGWGYDEPVSWTEPTALALLALSTRPTQESVIRGSRWLGGLQRKDGGWAPHPAVKESTWVTALAVSTSTATPLLATQQSRGVDWLARQTGKESGLLHVLRVLTGRRMEFGEGTVGWPWFPGTAAWIMPTALTVLALEKWMRRESDERIRKRIEEGRECLLARTCQDGGWNPGAPSARGDAAGSFADTTGVALLALHGVRSAKIDRAIAAAERHMASSRSMEARGWLALGLLAHGRNPGPVAIRGVRGRNAMDASLLILAQAAAAGKNVFLEAA